MLVLVFGHCRGEGDENIGTITDARINQQYSQSCYGSSEYELAMILKELRYITDQVGGLAPLLSILMFANHGRYSSLKYIVSSLHVGQIY